jgi:hypothetical protein
MNARVGRLAVLGALVCGAACAKPQPQGPPAATVAIVYSGEDLWIGNSDNPKLPPSMPRAPGVLNAMKAALDKADLAHTAPPSSLGMAVSFADRPLIRVPMGPIANLTGGALGTQADYDGNVGHDLVRTLGLALTELEKPRPGYKLLVVISEGTDTDPETARIELPKLRQRAAAHGIEVRSLVYKAELDPPGSDVIQWFSESRREMSADGLGTDLALELGRLGP